MVEGYLIRSGSVTFLVDGVVPAVVVVDVVSVSSSEKVSASLHGSASSPHCLRKIVRNAVSFSYATRRLTSYARTSLALCHQVSQVELKIVEKTERSSVFGRKINND